MNIEQNNLMYFIATPAVFTEYLGDSTPNLTMLKSGKAIAHMSACGDMPTVFSGDSRVMSMGYDAITSYLQFVDDYEGSEVI